MLTGEVNGERGRVLVTGANGFVGSALCTALKNKGHTVRAALRDPAKFAIDGCEIAKVPALDANTDWSDALGGVETVIHLAARVHVMHDNAADPMEEFRRVNVAGAEHLALSAVASGVKRLVFVSSIKVNGESTLSPSTSDGTTSHSTRPPKVGGLIAGYPTSGEEERNVFTETDIPFPQDPYGISKWEAEQTLHRIARETGLEVVIVRPPLVYGAGVKGNFIQMLKVLAKGIPLPLASVRNLRSLVYVGNLTDALILCATHPVAAGQTYLVSDGEDVSTPDLLCQLGTEMKLPARLFTCPTALLKLAGRITGTSNQIERLLGSLQVDSSKIRRELNWRPPFTLRQGLQATASWYRESQPFQRNRLNVTR